MQHSELKFWNYKLNIRYYITWDILGDFQTLCISTGNSSIIYPSAIAICHMSLVR